MNQKEYQRKKEMIQTSDADYGIRKQALESLEIEYRGVDRKKDLLKEISEGQAELRVGEV